MGLDLNGFVEVRSDMLWDVALNMSPYFGRSDYRVLYDLVDQIEEAQGYPRLVPSQQHPLLNYEKCRHCTDENHTFEESEELSFFLDALIAGLHFTLISPTWLSYAEFSRISPTFEPEYMRFCTTLVDMFAARHGPDNVRLVFWLL